MNLIVDFGNTSAKAGLFEGEELLKSFRDLSGEQLEELSSAHHPEHIWVASVGPEQEEITEWLGENVEFFTQNTGLPFNNDYKTPETLGHDRIAGVAGATFRFPGLNCLVIDAGTCITYDLITAENHYMGGAITPGLTMKSRAMHIFTARLPLIELINEPPLTGASTTESLQSGVLNGTLGEMQYFIDRYSAQYPQLHTLICGGDAKYFENKLKGAIFAAPELVLHGLNRIFLYNANEKN